jgi:hypothetical protein
MSNQSVDQLLQTQNHDQLDLIHKIRRAILDASPELVEGVKWNAPSYSFSGNDIITFNFRNYGSIALIFHTGPKGKDTHSGTHPFEDPSGIIQWLADKRFAVKISDENDFNLKKDRLQELVVEWVRFAHKEFEVE